MKEIQRREFLKQLGIVGAAFVAAGLLSVAGALAAATQPNILLITVDDMNFDTPGCLGRRI